MAITVIYPVHLLLFLKKNNSESPERVSAFRRKVERASTKR